MNTQNEFKLRFDTKPHAIDANTLLGTLRSMTNIIQEINREIGTNQNIDVKVKAQKKGSYVLDIELVQGFIIGMGSVFAAENAKYIPTVIKTFVDLTTLHKFLKGSKGKEKSKEGERTVVENSEGATMTIHNNGILNIYNTNPTIPKSYADAFDTLKKDPLINGFEVRDSDDNPLTTIARENFEELSHFSETKEEKSEISYTNNAFLSITRLSFETTSRTPWEFKFKGKKTYATISDVSFLRRVKDGERFGNGDTLEVDLEIEQVYNSALDLYVPKTYTIIKVHKHIPSGDQQQLFS